MKMKKKKVIISGAILISLLLIGLYFLFYNYIIEDETTLYSNSMNIIGKREGNSVEVNILEFDEGDCGIRYCYYANCENVVYFPCEKLIKNEFNSKGFYNLEFSFKKPALFPFGLKKKLATWSITEIEQKQEEISKERYLFGVKSILAENYIWEINSIPINPQIDAISGFYKNNEFNLSKNYFKSLYLLNELSNQLNDQELLAIFDKEISYLNSNAEEVLEKQSLFLEAYVLYLVEYGLDQRYLDFVKLSSEERMMEDYPPFQFEDNPLSSEEVFSTEYLHFLLYSEYSAIFDSFNLTSLAKYYSSKSSEIYNNSSFGIYGLCSNAKFHKNSELLEDLIPILERTFEDEEDYLIENNIKELLYCSSFSHSLGYQIVGIDDAIEELLANITINVDDKSFIIRTNTFCLNEDFCNDIIFTFELVDNLELLLYE